MAVEMTHRLFESGNETGLQQQGPGAESRLPDTRGQPWGLSVQPLEAWECHGHAGCWG